MHRAADDIADGDGDKRDGSEQNALYGSEDRSRSGNVQKIYQAVLPALHGYIVNSVVFRVSRSLTIIGSENLLTELAVKCGSAEEHDQTDYKSYHAVFPPKIVTVIFGARTVPCRLSACYFSVKVC